MSAIGRRYATALLELAQEQGQVDAVLQDIGKVSDAWEASADFKELVRNPVLPRSVVKSAAGAVLDKLGVSGLVKNTVSLLADRGRLQVLDEVLRAFQELAEGKSGRVRAEVTTPKPMPETYYEQLRSTLEKVTGRQVVLVKKQDPSLIGGVVTRVGDRIFDGSLSNRLNELRETLLADGGSP